ncbi:hypothetical protein Bbelb_295520 [Branchiostoma belcheri]|nr:hypothetical protein Bbelb_295520 [Branchiostoma belcheri]
MTPAGTPALIRQTHPHPSARLTLPQTAWTNCDCDFLERSNILRAQADFISFDHNSKKIDGVAQYWKKESPVSLWRFLNERWKTKDLDSSVTADMIEFVSPSVPLRHRRQPGDARLIPGRQLPDPANQSRAWRVSVAKFTVITPPPAPLQILQTFLH